MFTEFIAIMVIKSTGFTEAVEGLCIKSLSEGLIKENRGRQISLWRENDFFLVLICTLINAAFS